jgi:hypothetical protein
MISKKSPASPAGFFRVKAHPMAEPKTQLDKFKEAARDLETDDDEARFDEKIKKLVKAPQKSGGHAG